MKVLWEGMYTNLVGEWGDPSEGEKEPARGTDMGVLRQQLQQIPH